MWGQELSNWPGSQSRIGYRQFRAWDKNRFLNRHEPYDIFPGYVIYPFISVEEAGAIIANDPTLNKLPTSVNPHPSCFQFCPRCRKSTNNAKETKLENLNFLFLEQNRARQFHVYQEVAFTINTQKTVLRYHGLLHEGPVASSVISLVIGQLERTPFIGEFILLCSTFITLTCEVGHESTPSWRHLHVIGLLAITVSEKQTSVRLIGKGNRSLLMKSILLDKWVFINFLGFPTMMK
jgi:hypothetical protein